MQSPREIKMSLGAEGLKASTLHHDLCAQHPEGVKGHEVH